MSDDKTRRPPPLTTESGDNAWDFFSLSPEEQAAHKARPQ